MFKVKRCICSKDLDNLEDVELQILQIQLLKNQ